MTPDQLLLVGKPTLVFIVCVIIGRGIKGSPILPSWINVWVLPLAGAGLYWIFERQAIYAGFGFAIGGLSIYGHQLITQTVEGLSGSDDDKKQP